MKRKTGFLILGCLLLSILFMLPYLSNELSLEHDTLFHLSRIEGLAQSFKSGKLIPDLYPLKNDGFGYASALFYCDLFLVPAALLYLAGCGVAVCYKATIFLATFLSAWSMAFLMKKTHHSVMISLLAGALYVFCSYRITDVYVRGALGEVIAMAFLPLILLGTCECLTSDKPQTRFLILGFTGVALSHNLTLLLCVCGFGVLLLFNIRHLNKTKLICILKATFTSIALSAWFLVPMLEHTAFQTYYLHYYASSSDLSAHALNSWQYLINETIFGLSGNQYGAHEAMTLTPGIMLLFLPVLSLFDIRKQKTEIDWFAQSCTLAGFIFALICSRLIPWEHLSLFRIMQFPWRWLTLACPLLTFGSAHIIHQLFRQKSVISLLFVLTLCNGLYLLKPCFNRPLVIENTTTYEELLDGSIIDPYYADTSYNRIEVAGADYLPSGFLDYRNASHCITDLSGNEISCDVQNTDGFMFTAPEHTEIIIPLTAYKGYHVYSDGLEIPWKTVQGRLSIQTGTHTMFTVQYKKTPVHLASIAVSLLFLLGLPAFQKRNQNRKQD